MVQIIRLTYHDDKDASTSVEVMVCSSLEAAEEIILKEMNEGFQCKWNNLKEVAKDLNSELDCCMWDEDGRCFTWMDNGKGESYNIGRVNVREVNTKFQMF